MLIPKFTNLLQSTSRNICFYQNHFFKINTAFLHYNSAVFSLAYTPCHFETHGSSFILLMLHKILSDKAIIKASCIKISVSHTLNTVYETCVYLSSKLSHYGNQITLRSIVLTSRSTSSPSTAQSTLVTNKSRNVLFAFMCILYVCLSVYPKDNFIRELKFEHVVVGPDVKPVQNGILLNRVSLSDQTLAHGPYLKYKRKFIY